MSKLTVSSAFAMYALLELLDFISTLTKIGDCVSKVIIFDSAV